MSKTSTLIKALRKNGRSMAAVKNMGQESASISFADMAGMLVPTLMVIASGALAWLLTAGPWGMIGNVLPLAKFLEVLCTGLSMMIIVFTLMKLITTMYLGDDLHVLLTLPFSEMQITMAKTCIVAEKRYLNNACIIIPFTVVWALCKGATANELIAAALMVLLLPLTMMSVTGVLVMLLMRFVRVVRNKNLLKIVGSVIGLILLNVVIFFIQTDEARSDPQAMIQSLTNMADGVRAWFPVTGLVADVAANGTVTSILLLFVIAAAAFALYMLAAKALYLRAALSMTAASTAQRELDDAALAKALTHHEPWKSIVIRDRRTILRTPAFLTNGLVSPLSSNVFMMLLLIISMTKAAGDRLAGRAASVCVVFAFFGLAAALAYISNISVAGTAFTREGQSFSATHSLPIAPQAMLRAKRDVAMHFGLASAFLPALVAVVILCALGKIPPLSLLFGPVFAVAVLWINADFQILADLKDPNFIWENPGDIRKNTVLSFVLAFITIVVMTAAVVLTVLWRTKGDFPYAGHVVYGVFSLVALAAAFIFDKHYFKKGAELLAKL